MRHAARPLAQPPTHYGGHCKPPPPRSELARTLGGTRESAVAVVEVLETAKLEDIEVIETGVFSHGRAQAAGGNARNVYAFVRDAGALVGGACGRTEYGRLFVNSLWVQERMRGQGIGRRTLDELEGEAVARGCVDSLLDTLLPENVEFYLRCGYTVVASVPRYIGPFTRTIMVKQLTCSEAEHAA
jgi:GNAT superfamily N-acetyltransferase